MEYKTAELQRALREVVEIRGVLERVVNRHGAPLRGNAFQIQLVAHSGALLFSTGLAALEIFTHHNSTNFLYYSYQDERWRLVGVGGIAVFVALLTLSLYLSMWRAARREGEEVNSWIERNCSYLRGSAFLSDLFCKFASVALLILARRPDWVAPLLLLFTGDYLLQGRFFFVPLRAGLMCGLLLVAGSFIQLIYFEGIVLYPLVVFIVITLWSMVRLTAAAREVELRRAE